MSAVEQTIWRSPSRDRPPPWDLPEVTNEEVEEAVREMSQARRQTSGGAGGRARQTTNENGAANPPKRACSRSLGRH